MGPFEGIRVVDLSEGIGGPLAAMLFADYGAEVVKVEPPRGDRLRGTPHFHVLNRSKRGIVADLDQPEHVGRLRALLLGADVVIASGPDLRRALGGLDPADLRAANPGLVLVHVPLYGTHGPLAHVPEHEMLLAALSGQACQQLTYTPGPAYMTAPLAGYAHGVLTANAIAAALVVREECGAGQLVEVSGLRGVHGYECGGFIFASGVTAARRPTTPRIVLPTYGFFQGADGLWFFVGALNPAQWVKLALALGLEDLLDHPQYVHGPMGVADREAFLALQHRVEEAFRKEPRAFWLRRLREHDVPFGPVNPRLSLFEEEQVRHLGLAARVQDPEVGPTTQMGLPIDFRETPGQVRGGAPLLDPTAPWPSWERQPERGHPSLPPGRGPLARTVVLDVATFIAGAFASTVLSDLGADVIKVEPRTGDPWRQWGLGFLGWNRGKRSVMLDLKDEADRERFLGLVERADIVVDNLRPGIAERLGIDHARLAAVNPRVVSVSVSANGASGPLAELPGYDQVFQARSGLSHQQGGGDGQEPIICSIAPNDHTAAALAAFAALAGLYVRAHTGRGQHAETSVLQGSMMVGAGELVFYEGRPPQVMGGRDARGRTALDHAYCCGDGLWVYVVARNESEWRALASVLEHHGRLAEWPWERARAEGRAGALAEELAEAFSHHGRDAMVDALLAAGVPCMPCVEVAEVFAHPHHALNSPPASFEHERWGTIRLPGPFANFGDTPVTLSGLAPALGTHTEAVLAEFGISRLPAPATTPSA